MRQQERAALAFNHVSHHAGKETKAKYGVYCMKAPVLLKTAGLVQTLEFIASRNEPEATAFLGDLAKQLVRVDSRITDAAQLRARARGAAFQDYLLLTQELSATLLWYRRFAQSVLKIDPTRELGEKKIDPTQELGEKK